MGTNIRAGMSKQSIERKQERVALRRRAIKVVWKIAKDLGIPQHGTRFVDVARKIISVTGWDIAPSHGMAPFIIVRYWAHINDQPLPETPSQVTTISSPKRQIQKKPSRMLKDFQAQSKEERAAFYKTPEWRRLRYAALRKHGAKCQCCGATAESSGAPLHVDHIKPRWHHPELQLDLDNLQILCEDCNIGKGAWDQTDWRPETEEPVNELDAEYKRILQ